MTAKHRKRPERAWWQTSFWLQLRSTQRAARHSHGYRQGMKVEGLRSRYLREVNDPTLVPAERPPKPRRNDKRRPSKPR